MNKQKVQHHIEIIEVFTYEGNQGYGPIKEHIIVIPDQSVMMGYKKIFDNKVFVSPPNYDDIKLCASGEGVLEMLGLLEEVKL